MARPFTPPPPVLMGQALEKMRLPLGQPADPGFQIRSNLGLNNTYLEMKLLLSQKNAACERLDEKYTYTNLLKSKNKLHNHFFFLLI